MAKENGTDEKRIDWERNMFSEKPGSQQQEGSVDLSIVVPAYNETERLPAMLDQAIEFLQNPKVCIFYPAADKKGGEGFSQQDIPTKLLGSHLLNYGNKCLQKFCYKSSYIKVDIFEKKIHGKEVSHDRVKPLLG